MEENDLRLQGLHEIMVSVPGAWQVPHEPGLSRVTEASRKPGASRGIPNTVTCLIMYTGGLLLGPVWVQGK